MTIARKELVDVSVTRWYYCITRGVRRAFLLGDGLRMPTGRSCLASSLILVSSIFGASSR